MEALGNALAEKGDWKRASKLFTQLVDLVPGNVWYWQAYVYLRLQLGEPFEYGKDMLRLFSRPNPLDARAADAVAWTLSLTPDPAVDRTYAVKQAEHAMTGAKRWQHFNTLGAANYRAGNYALAIGNIKDGMKLNPSGGTAWDWVFLALANHKLGKGDEAREWLAKTAAFVKEVRAGKLPEKGGPGGPLDWKQHLELDLLLAEADMLIQKKSPE